MGRRRGSATWGLGYLRTSTEWVSDGPVMVRLATVRQRGESSKGVET